MIPLKQWNYHFDVVSPIRQPSSGKVSCFSIGSEKYTLKCLKSLPMFAGWTLINPLSKRFPLKPTRYHGPEQLLTLRASRNLFLSAPFCCRHVQIILRAPICSRDILWRRPPNDQALASSAYITVCSTQVYPVSSVSLQNTTT